jgi:hypothetical protein
MEMNFRSPDKSGDFLSGYVKFLFLKNFSPLNYVFIKPKGKFLSRMEIRSMIGTSVSRFCQIYVLVYCMLFGVKICHIICA